MSIYRNSPLGHIVETHEQIDERGFACTCRSDNGHHLTWIDFKIKVADQWLIFHILEVHMVKANLSSQFLVQSFIFTKYFIWFIKYLEDPIQ